MSREKGPGLFLQKKAISEVLEIFPEIDFASIIYNIGSYLVFQQFSKNVWGTCDKCCDT